MREGSTRARARIQPLYKPTETTQETKAGQPSLGTEGGPVTHGCAGSKRD